MDSVAVGQLVEEEFDANLLQDIESAGSALDKAQIFLEDFQKSRVEILPAVLGSLYAQGNLTKKQFLRYFKLQVQSGLLIKFESEAAYAKFQTQSIDVLALTKKAREKHKIELVYLKKIVSLSQSFRDEFTKQKSQHCIELYYDNDQILYLACYDSDQIKQWQQYIKKAMHFYDWFEGLKAFLESDQDNLTEHVSYKLNEIVEFVEQYSSIERVEIPFIAKSAALANDKKRLLLKQHSILKPSDDEETKTESPQPVFVEE